MDIKENNIENNIDNNIENNIENNIDNNRYNNRDNNCSTGDSLAGKDCEKGIDIARGFYEEYGRPMLLRLFPELAERIAAGLCGQGSECFGYDDPVSRDHDFRAGFCLWLSEEDYERYGFKLYRAYEKLPEAYKGIERGHTDFLRPGRRGVYSIPEFYRMLTGSADAPEEDADWFRIPEYALAEAVNGTVFEDRLGEFSRVRERFAAGYPNDVRKKKIAARAALMAQSGQYNYSRCLSHGEEEAAELSLGEFVTHAAAMIFLINNKYMPYYKWRFRRLRELPILQNETALLSGLLLGKNKTEAKERIMLIEAVCRAVARELVHEGLSDSADEYLEAHAFSVMEHISDPEIRAMHVMDGI